MWAVIMKLLPSCMRSYCPKQNYDLTCFQMEVFFMVWKQKKLTSEYEWIQRHIWNLMLPRQIWVRACNSPRWCLAQTIFRVNGLVFNRSHLQLMHSRLRSFCRVQIAGCTSKIRTKPNLTFNIPVLLPFRWNIIHWNRSLSRSARFWWTWPVVWKCVTWLWSSAPINQMFSGIVYKHTNFIWFMAQYVCCKDATGSQADENSWRPMSKPENYPTRIRNYVVGMRTSEKRPSDHRKTYI